MENTRMYITRSATIAFTAIVALLVFTGCTKNKQPMIESVTERKLTPQIFADSITTIISDSGIIRYRITAQTWAVYDKADTPYWDFPDGLRFERFDPDYNIDAEIECNRAVYYSKMEIWKLNDSVKAVNLSGEKFETSELYWNQKTETVHSDSDIVITQKNQTIYGTGFESNQTFSKYSIKRPKGAFPIEE